MATKNDPLKMEMINWDQTNAHLALVNAQCCLREPIDTRSNLHNRDKATTRTYRVLNAENQVVGAFTIRTNAWYLAEVKYIFANTPKILAFILRYALALSKRPIYQVTVGASENKLRDALAAVGFTNQCTFTYKDRKVDMYSKAVEERAEAPQLLPAEEAAILQETPGTKAFLAAKKAAKKELPAPKEVAVATVSVAASPTSRYPDEEFRGTKVHKHSGLGWHSLSIKHKDE